MRRLRQAISLHKPFGQVKYIFFRVLQCTRAAATFKSLSDPRKPSFSLKLEVKSFPKLQSDQKNIQNIKSYIYVNAFLEAREQHLPRVDLLSLYKLVTK